MESHFKTISPTGLYIPRHLKDISRKFRGCTYRNNFSDFFLSTEFIPRRRLKKWFEREGFQIRKILILKWLFLGNVITMAYKSTLLSSLVTIRYESTIDTVNDLVQSGLPALIPNNTAVQYMFASDPRKEMKNVYNRSIIFNIEPPFVPGELEVM